MPVTISNCSNNYGPYQFPEKLIPLMIFNALEGVALPVYGDGMNVRDWLYVKDHCEAIWTIMKHGRRGATYNVGGGCEKENITLVKMICRILDEEIPPDDGKPREKLIRFVEDRPGHDRRYAIDSSRLRHELGWTPVETMESGIRKTIRWYLENDGWASRVRSGEYQQWIEAQYKEGG
jgi:dTDP-glucose 4,6-dehydratase